MIRRLVEAGTRTLPVMLLLVLPVIAGMGSLYIWTWPDVRAHDANIQFKANYLNVPFFIVRIVLYFAIWMFFARLLRGCLNKEIAGELGLQEVTVKVHKKHIMTKLRTRTLVDLLMVGRALGMLPDLQAELA